MIMTNKEIIQRVREIAETLDDDARDFVDCEGNDFEVFITCVKDARDELNELLKEWDK